MNFLLNSPRHASPPVKNAHLALLGRLAGLMAQIPPALASDAELEVQPVQVFDAALTEFLLSLTPARPVHATGGLAPKTMRRVTAFVDDNIDRAITIVALAGVAGLSKSHFCRSFAVSAGVSPHMFIMRRRIERAQALIAETGEPLAKVALACGLSDQAHLTRLFRRFAGVTPGQWRHHLTSAGAIHS